MFGFFRRKITPHPSTDIYGYRLATTADLNGGALEFAFQPTLMNPGVQIEGAGSIVGGMRTLTTPFVMNHAIGVPNGIPQTTQNILIQPPSKPKTGKGK